ncbi:conjugal transfer protein [Phenylobacterium sp. Root77]|jgi:type IV secretion system protein VirB9|uniref:TrbG/VirB9 family P-type conjugative transfer protein n=1 Tax=unclassified Phenylobacterium TaxID=2640670 RepID=UPI0006F6CEE6|nr:MULTISPECIES: TrbG/VirB9 family P-type conjugative transfer protein [unclassified Phenylobacterium]KQW67028.1 conjugal transfer protein [Phenylobacterium sp. Root1277]KQW89721.1 conjugal transfer protein [Phenylobacterium sp. Root1290]KRC43590.1 conjugal transfer protein [Phenylobacterium sp. Root77]
MSPRLHFLAGLAGLALAASPANAAPSEATPPPDARIRTIDYAAGSVVRVPTGPRTATQLVFGEGESVRHAALGDPAGWEVVAEDGVLFLKPKSARASTNLIVTTQASAGTARHYHFELVAGPGERALFAVRLRHPGQDAVRLATAIDAQAAALERKVIDLQLERGAIEGPRNLDYVLAGDEALAPSEVSDNGRFTVLRFPGARPLPAIYLLGADGAERLARFDVRGEFVVVHETAPALRLRRGRALLCILNRAYGQGAQTAATGTASPEIRRSVERLP